MSTAALLLAMAYGRILAPLADWPPVGALLDDLISSAKGYGSIDGKSISRLQKWSKIYEELPKELSQFYSANAEDPAMSPLLWFIFERHEKPEGVKHGKIVALFESAHGHPPHFSLYP